MVVLPTGGVRTLQFQRGRRASAGVVKAGFLEEEAFAPVFAGGVFSLSGKDVSLSDGAGERKCLGGRGHPDHWGAGVFVLIRFRACEVSEAGKVCERPLMTD